MTIGERIKEIRKLYKMSQEELAEKIGVTHSAISRYESNIVPIPQDNIIKFAEIFNVTTDYILTGNNEPMQIAGSTNGLDLSEISEKNKKILMQMYEMLKNEEE